MRGRWSLTLGLACGLVGCTTEPGTTGSVEDAWRTRRPPPKLTQTSNQFVTFETGQVRPLALSPDGQFLYAVNTPDNRLEVFRVHRDRLEHLSSVAVGLEPIAVAARGDDEVWVVNHLSDSVSILDVGDCGAPRVTRTLLVGDEPRDIVFAGARRERAFITTAHRGQSSPVDPQLSTPGVGRADVFVFDANNLGATAGGTPLTVVTLFADTPRALAVSPDGRTVYAAAFNSGNQTTVVAQGAVALGGGLPPPVTITLPTPAGPKTIAQPGTALIVKRQNGHWVDRTGKAWDAYVNLNLPDKDVFAIDAAANPPQQTRFYTSVGTTLFNLAVNPRSGKVYVANTDARNDVRFEGHGNALGGAGDKTVRGHIAESRITVLDGDAVLPRHLNKHIDYSVEGTPAEADKSLAFPQGMAISSDGATLYVAAQGSSKIGVFSTAALEKDTFVPDRASQIAVSGGGPTGVVLDEKHHRLFALTRFDNAISIVDTTARAEVGKVAMFNPEPPSVTLGRKFLYDAAHTSSHGDSACASCHIAGDFDGLAWDLGDPDGAPKPIPGPYTFDPQLALAILPFAAPVFAALMPLKGPMTTQSLRGMDNHGPMHWRGDRNGAFTATGAPVAAVQPNGGIYSEDAAFKAFNVAFPGLLGRAAPLTDAELQQFTDFVLQVMYPPNPIRNLDNSLTAEQQAGHDFYFNSITLADGKHELPVDRFHNCNGCHTLDRAGNAALGVPRPGFFGSDGRYSFENETQIFKVPHTRNMYQKVGMFGMSPEPLIPTTVLPGGVFNTGDQIRGFGFQHDGAIDTLERFFALNVFIQQTGFTTNPGGPSFPQVPPNPYGIPVGDAGLPLRRAIESFMFASETNFAPIVGQQVTLTYKNAAAASARITLMETRAAAGECDLVARTSLFGAELGWLFAGGTFTGNRTALPPLTDAELRAVAWVVPITFTCAPPGTGARIALDRDADGFADGDEQDYGTSPTDPASHP